MASKVQRVLQKTIEKRKGYKHKVLFNINKKDKNNKLLIIN